MKFYENNGISEYRYLTLKIDYFVIFYIFHSEKSAVCYVIECTELHGANKKYKFMAVAAKSISKILHTTKCIFCV